MGGSNRMSSWESGLKEGASYIMLDSGPRTCSAEESE